MSNSLRKMSIIEFLIEYPLRKRGMYMSTQSNITHWQERVDMAAAFRWTERLNFHEAVANHFSLAVNEDGTQFLMNPNQMHFARIKASDLLLLDANNPDVLDSPDAPDPTAWGLHGAVHRNCPHARCVMHVHSIHATVLASLKDSNLPPMGNHGVLVVGDSVADTFNRLYYFERAAETYIRALQTGQPLRLLSDEIAEKTAQELDDYPDQADKHFSELKAILDEDGSNYAS
jgi:ribulose-5-phosphate 4-epimerase/fuculose-1-phosphate aldolase